MNINDWQEELDKGLWHYVKTHGLIHEEGLKIDDLFEYGIEFLKNLGLFVIKILEMVVLFIFYIPLIVACHRMEKREVVKAYKEAQENIDRVMRKKMRDAESD